MCADCQLLLVSRCMEEDWVGSVLYFLYCLIQQEPYVPTTASRHGMYMQTCTTITQFTGCDVTRITQIPTAAYSSTPAS